MAKFLQENLSSTINNVKGTAAYFKSKRLLLNRDVLEAKVKRDMVSVADGQVKPVFIMLVLFNHVSNSHQSTM